MQLVFLVVTIVLNAGGGGIWALLHLRGWGVQKKSPPPPPSPPPFKIRKLDLNITLFKIFFGLKNQ